MGQRNHALFVGRLTPEKGLITLLEAWRSLPHIPLKIVGDGPLRPWVTAYIQEHQLHQVEWVGFVPLAKVLEYQQQALFLVMPSLWYETFGRVIFEAYATATPVLASQLGAMTEVVEAGKTGLLFQAGNAADLAAKANYAFTHPQQLRQWGQTARARFEERFLAEMVYHRLMTLYHRLLTAKAAPTR
ncbi:glycosyltransferase family 4 protein [Neosynechococcus sphagnicola]|uniref:glycosyltransferase family 4 protein n=1 Tax=Neosynechococcus sphagnicola TaxID=1501145 RepID=UPI0019553D61|nr:glycosyltransferase [Neosynechococcus sphagnicola]